MAKRQRLARRTESGPDLTAMQRDYLLDGAAMLIGSFFDDADHLRRAWDANRADVIAEFIRTRPGRRPRAWWMFDAPGPRLLVNGSTVTTSSPGAGYCGMQPGRAPGEHEPEAAYLARHGRLFESERTRLS